MAPPPAIRYSAPFRPKTDEPVHLVGEVDLSTVDDLRAMLEALSEDGHAVALDLAHVTFMDSSGMHAFEAYASTLNGSRPLVLQNAPAHVHRIFELTGARRIPTSSFGASIAVADVVSLGDRLRQRRTELGLSQAQAARELDVARTAHRLWEVEAAKPAPDRRRLLSRSSS